MKHFFRFLLPVLLIVVLCFSQSCNKLPDHAHYIPKDAALIVGLNTKALTKKIAWDVITGSKIFDELMSHTESSKNILKDIERTGIDEYNTFYTYVKGDGNNESANIVMLLPLKNAMKWEGFLKATFNGIEIKELKKRKEARLADNMYMGWTNNMLIILTIKETPLPNEDMEESTPQAFLPADDVLLASCMESAFNVTAEQSIIDDKRFVALDNSNYDLELWMNFELLMNTYGAKAMAAYTGGMSLANKLWKDAVFTSGLNFDKGRITTDMLFYSSDEMKEVYKEFSKENIDKDLLDKVPVQGLNYLLAYHMSPAGIKMLLEKMNLTGLVNMALAEQKLGTNELLDAFTGDMVFAINNFKLHKDVIPANGIDTTSSGIQYKNEMDVLFALKLKNKENFKKILNIAVGYNILWPVDSNTYMVKSANADTPLLIMTDKYVVFANKGNVARSFADSKSKKTELPMIVKDNIYMRPFGMFFDFQEVSKGLLEIPGSGAQDSIVFAEARSTFENYIFNGGKYEKNALKYQMNINFINKEENSLLLLLNMAVRIQNAGKALKQEL